MNLDLELIAKKIISIQSNPEFISISLDELTLSPATRSKQSLCAYISTLDVHSSFIVWDSGEIETIIHSENHPEVIETVQVGSNNAALQEFFNFINILLSQSS